MLSLIVARAARGAIGREGTIPWFAPEDLAFFKRETMGGALIMGRRTWESLPVRPLKQRFNIVVTSRDLDADAVCRDVRSAMDLARDAGYRRLYGIGGARIYADLLPYADRLLVTHVDAVIDDADTFFPDIDDAEWRDTGTLVLREQDPRCILTESLRA